MGSSRTPVFFNVFGFDVGLITAGAVEHSDGSRQGIRDALEKLKDLPAINGPVTYTPTDHTGRMRGLSHWGSWRTARQCRLSDGHHRLSTTAAARVHHGMRICTGGTGVRALRQCLGRGEFRAGRVRHAGRHGGGMADRAGGAVALAILAATALGAIAGAAQEVLTLAPVRRQPHFIQITTTVGFAVVLRGITLIVAGKDALSVPGFSGDGVFFMFGAILPVQSLWVWGATVLLLVGTFWFLRYTSTGRAVRACSINLQAARLMGVNAERLRVVVFAVSGATGRWLAW